MAVHSEWWWFPLEVGSFLSHNSLYCVTAAPGNKTDIRAISAWCTSEGRSTGVTVAMPNIAVGQRQWYINQEEMAIKMSTMPVLERWDAAGWRR